MNIEKFVATGIKSDDYLKHVQKMIDYGKNHYTEFDENSLSDGYHTFDELYEFRKMYNAALFNEWYESRCFN